MVEALGLDFGTSNCTVAIYDSKKGVVKTLPISNHKESKKKNLANQSLFPSKIGLTDDFEYVFGAETYRCSRDFVWDNSKRLLEHNTPIYRGGTHKKPIWVAIGIISGIFKQLKDLSIKTTTPMVITVPANSYSIQRSLTRLSAETLGFKVNQLVSEPCAAALACYEHIEKLKYVLVVDVGGGTTDIALLENNFGTIKEISIEGLKRFGGLNVDQKLFNFYKDKFDVSTDSEQLLLRDLLEDVKIELSSKKKTKLIFKDTSIEVERSVIQKLIEKDLVSLQKAIDRVTKKGNIEPKNIEAVLPIGGSSNIPAIREVLKKKFKTKLINLSFDESITAVAKGAALGSAINSKILDDLDFKQCLEHSVGLRIWKGTTNNKVFSPILKKGEIFPASRVKRFISSTDNAIVALYESTSEKLKNNDTKLIIEKKIETGIIHVDVEITYDDDGKIGIKTYNIKKDELEKLGDLGDRDADSESYLNKLKSKAREKGMDLKIDSISYLDSSLNEKELKQWSHEFLGKYQRYRKISENVKDFFKKQEDIEAVSVNNVEFPEIKEEGDNDETIGSSNDAFILASGVLKESLKIIMLNSGFKTISDFENIQKVLSENDITWKTTQKRIPERPLEDSRWMIKVFLKARYFENLKHIDDDSIRENLYSLRTILNKFSHGVRSSFFNLFTDSLDEYEAVIEKDILDEVYKSSKYNKQDVVLLSSKIVDFLNSLLKTKYYTGREKENLAKMLERMITIKKTYER